MCGHVEIEFSFKSWSEFKNIIIYLNKHEHWAMKSLGSALGYMQWNGNLVTVSVRVREKAFTLLIARKRRNTHPQSTHT